MALQVTTKIGCDFSQFQSKSFVRYTFPMQKSNLKKRGV